jgi:alpha-tubulin suppressor-like RCC1 family protein
MYMKIGGSYYFTLGSGGLSGSWNGSGYNAVALQQCNQTTGLPLYDTSGNPLPPDMTGTAGLPITLYPKWPLSPASWTVHSAGTGPPPYPQSPLYAIDWFANEHPLLVPGSYLRIAGVYYLVLGTNGIPGSWSGTQFNSTALQQCDQSNGNPLYDSNGNYLLPDMSATVGQSIALFDSFPVVPPAAPSSEVLYPVNGSVLSSSRYTVTGIASPGGAPAIGKVEISINGGAWTLAAGTGAWTYDWTISGDGTYTLRSRVTDSLGRVETAGTGVTVTVAHGSGTSWGVGYNFNGQLGNNTRTDATWPVQTTGLSGITALATRGNISLGLKADGTVWVWGETSGIAPARVTSLSGMIGVAQGQYDSVALKNDGTVWSWQWGGPPVRVGTLAGIAAIAAGNGHFLALKNDGTVWAWGGNQYGQLGDGTSTDRSTPVQVSGLGGVKAISCGGYHSMALRNDGTVWSWGINQEGQLGAGWGFTEAWSPVAHPNPLQAIGLSNVTAIAGGGSHAAALKSDGTMWVWGWDKMGQLGNGAITVNGYEATGIPQQVPGIYGVTAIAAGNNHTLAVLSNGSLWGWGQGDGGQLGNGRSGCYQCESITSPWQISGFANVVAAAGGSSHTLALQSATPVSAPSSSITSPAWGADITSATVTITGTASGSAGSGVVAVQISTNGGTTWASASGTTPWSYTWTPTADGSVLIKTRALDTAGKMEGPVYGTAVFVDRTAPACTITSPTAGALLTGSAVTVSGTATDGAGRGVTSVEISADGGNNWSTATGTTSWSYSWSLPTDGTYTLLCRATDGVGHAATGTGVAVRVDNLRITSPASGASLGGTSFAITGTASSAGNGVQAVEVSVNGNDGPWAPAAGTSSWSYLWTLPADGSYTIVARATDNLGGQTLSQPVTVLVDNAAPLTLATPPGGAFNSPVRVTLTSSESAAIYYTTDGNAPNTGSARYSAPLTLAATTTLRFFAVDAAGNPEVVKTAQYTVDPVLFQPRSESPVDVGLPVAAGDFTGDGKIDLVAMTIYTAYLIPGNGDGTLGTPRSIWNGDYPSGAAAGDFDGDGKLDLAISSPVTSTISVLYGNDDGSFRSRTDYAAGGGEVAAADLTGDGKADIAVANSGVSVFISNGDGSFQPRADYPAGSAPRAIAAADFDRGGKAGLAVANYNSNSVSVLLNDGSAGFSRRTDYPVGTHPFAVVAGDFNGDGYPDLAVANGDGNSVSILVNRGNGAFMPKVDYAMGTHPYELQVADFNGDGIADLAVGNIITFSILLGNGDGTFQPKLDYAGGSTNIYGLTAADLNGDGRPDLAFTNAGLRKIAVYLNSNRPAPPVTTPSVRSGFYPAAQSVVLTADRPATIYYTTDGRTPTTASAIYAAPIPVAAPTTLRFFAVDAASNAEQVKTCVYTIDATAPAGSLNINGGATFTTSPSVILYVVASDGVGVAQMQFSNDGTTWSYPEPFVASRNWTLPAGWGTKTVFARFRDFAGNWSAQAQASILLNTAPVTTVSPAGGSFNTPQTVNLTTFESAAIYYTTDGSIPTTSSTGYTAPITIAATTTLRFFAVGAGGNQEAVKSQTYIIDQVPPTGTVSINGGAAYTSSSTVTLSLGASDSSGVSQMQFSNNGSTWSEPEPYATSRTWSLIAGDGTKTVFVKFRDSLGNWSPAVSATILLDFSSSFLPGVSYDTWADSRGVVAADFNGDGILDLAVANNDTGTASILIGNSDGTFKPRVNYPAGSGPVAVVAADFNGDGTIDLAVADRNENAVSVLLGNGDGTFRSRSAFTTGAAPCGLAVGDLNGDGRQDLIAANIGGSSLSVLLGNGDGTFAPKADYPVGGPVAVTVADFNGDGKPDLASANYGSATLSVLLGNGDGTFQGSVQYTTGNSPYAVTAADFNRDGKADIAVANYGSNTVSVFLGNGDGSFLPKADFGTGSFPAAVATGDFNGDDIIDLAVANRTGNTVSVLVGNGNGTFQNKVDYPAGTGPTCVVMADFNRDGKADIAVADTGGYWRNGQVTVLTSNIPIRIARSPMVGFQTLQEAYQNVADGDIIQSRSGTITGTLQLTREVTISIKGGYDGKYESNSSYTTIIGDLKISAGTVQVENLNFR